MHTQHWTKWLEYDAIHSSFEWDQLFTDVLVVFNISIKAHFVSKFVGERQIVFDINKDIVKTIVSNMTYKIEDEVDSDNEDVEENLVFSNEAKQTVVLVWCRATVAKAK